MTRGDRRTVIAAFTEEEARRLTGISLRQLRDWDRTGFFHPSLAEPEGQGPHSRLYSFRDLVSLQVLNALRNVAKISLPHLRDVKKRLADLGDDLWAKTTLFVLRKEVVFLNEHTQDREVAVSGQKVLRIPLQVVRADMEKSVQTMRKRDREDLGKIQKKKGVVSSRPVVAGTRIQVASIKAFHDAGYSVEEILKEYPNITERDIEAAIAFASAA